MRLFSVVIAVAALWLGGALHAAEQFPPVEMALTRVSDHVYYVKGAPGTAVENHGFISNAAAIVTDDGVILVDALGSPALARMFLQRLRQVTDQPIKKVILTHYHADHFYGLQVFKEMGAEIVAPAGAEEYLNSEHAARLLEERRTALAPWVNRETYIVKPDRYVEGDETIGFGGLTLKLIANGKAHSDGDQGILVEPDGVLLSGDLIFEGRLPFVGDADTRIWLERLRVLEGERLVALVPGHGPYSERPRDVIKATLGYLDFLRTEMGRAVEAMIPFDEAYAATDWTAFSHLPAFEQANRKNAFQVYLSLEQEGMGGGGPR